MVWDIIANYEIGNAPNSTFFNNNNPCPIGNNFTNPNGLADVSNTK